MYSFGNPEGLVTLCFFLAHSFFTRFPGGEDSYTIPPDLSSQVVDQPTPTSNTAGVERFGRDRADSSMTITPQNYSVSGMLQSYVSNPSMVSGCIRWLNIVNSLDNRVG